MCRPCDGRARLDGWKLGVLFNILPLELARHVERIVTNMAVIHDEGLPAMRERLELMNGQIKLMCIKYLLNLADKPQYLRLLMRRYKYEQHVAEVATIYETLINVVDDVIGPVLDGLNETPASQINTLDTIKRVNSAIQELNELRYQTNNALLEHERTCECSKYVFDANFERQRI
jgi:hypothetical protein